MAQLVCTIRQARFLQEIAKYNYNKDEAYAEIINRRSENMYNQYEKCIEWYFDDCKTEQERKNLIELVTP